MKLFASLICFILLNNVSIAQLKVTKLIKSEVPVGIHYVGHIIEVYKFIDTDGEHLVLTTETGEVKSKKSDVDDGRDADLWAYGYKIIGKEISLAWQVHDFIRDCPVDLRAKYIPNTFAITDLNNDGKAEIWLMYRTVCHGDVSPSIMKIIMYEGNKKYAVRGNNKVKVSDNPVHYEGGNYVFDEAFKLGAEVFRKYAEGLWKKNLIEKWD